MNEISLGQNVSQSLKIRKQTSIWYIKFLIISKKYGDFSMMRVSMFEKSMLFVWKQN